MAIKSLTFAWFVALLTIVTLELRAAEITRKDGSTIRGTIISEDDEKVVLSVTRKGMTLKTTLTRAEIAKIDREAPASDPAAAPSPATPSPAEPLQPPANVAAAATYCPVPLIGVIGKEVTAASVKAALGEARVDKADYVLLIIDSPGGAVAEAEAILDLLNVNRDLNLVAYVRQALSAGAIIAMACPTIVMTPNATIGAAVPFKMGPKGTPQVIEEKFQSVLRARCRASAEQAGHSPLLIDGMMDADVVLSTTTDNGKPVVVQGMPASSNLLKPRGKILTLTSTEAAACGLSSGTSATPEGANVVLNVPQWRRGTNRAMAAANQKAQDELKEKRYTEVKVAKEAQKAEVRRLLQPQIAQIQEQLAVDRTKGRAVQDTLANLEAENQAEIRRVNDELALTLRGIDPRQPSATAQIRRAQEFRDLKLYGIQERYQPQFTRLEGTINVLNREQQLLVGKLRDLEDELKRSEKR